MCCSCGNGVATDDHGDARNITLRDLAQAAAASGITLGQAKDNIAQTSIISSASPLRPSPLELFKQTMGQPLIVCDIDGVLAFLAESIFGALNAMFGTMYDAHTFKAYWVEGSLPRAQSDWLKAWLDNPFAYVNLAPDLPAIQSINRLMDAGYDVVIATDRPVSAEGITARWLDRWSVKFNDLKVGPGGKDALAQAHGPENPMILFDDSPERLHLARPGVQVWQPKRPWTVRTDSDYVTVFDDWAKMLAAMGVA